MSQAGEFRLARLAPVAKEGCPLRLVTYEIQTVLGRHQRLGAEFGDQVIDLNFATAWRLARGGESRPQKLADVLVPATMREFLEAGERAIAEASATMRLAVGLVDALTRLGGPNGETLLHDRDAVRIVSPLPDPQSLRDFFAFEEHVKTGFAKRGEEIPAPWYDMPVYYKGNARTILGPDQELPWPRYTQQLDFELELACVIGREGRNILVEEAQRYIAGYTIMNDVSARDIQRKEMMVRLGPAKGKDFATVLGPTLVTPDEVGDLKDLPMTVRVNGETWSSGNAGSAYWTFAQMIAHVSMDETIYPGDVFGSGTVGRGCGLELDRWIQPGDVIELEVARLGVLRNRVGQRIDEPLPVLRHDSGEPGVTRTPAGP